MQIFIKRQKRNYQSGAAVIRAINWFFSHVDYGLIIEDDLVVNETFIPYVKKSLPYLDENDRCLMICGTRLLPENSDSATLSSYPNSWGWATSKEKWLTISKLIFDPMGKLKLIVKPSEWLYWYVGKKRALLGISDAWDTPLAAGMWSKGFYSMIPPVNLVSNLGFDSAATHTLTPSWPLGLQTEEFRNQYVKLDMTRECIRKNNKFLRQKIFKKSYLYVLKFPFTLLSVLIKNIIAPQEVLIDKVGNIE